MEIYHDILIGLEQESKTHSLVKKTRLQHHSNLSYDKFSRHLNDMAARGLVNLNPLSITDKGREFVREYSRIRAFMREIGARFFATELPLQRLALELVDRLPSMHHSVLLYEDRHHADLVAAEFLSQGLSKGESCVYLTFENPKTVERRLIPLAGNIGEGLRNQRLRIYPEDLKTQRRASSFKSIERLVDDSTSGMKPPFRIFGDFVQLIAKSGFQAQLSEERLLHQGFDGLGITMLCWYDLKRMAQRVRSKFVELITEQHDHVIFASDPSRAFGFDSKLLAMEE